MAKGTFDPIFLKIRLDQMKMMIKIFICLLNFNFVVKISG